VQEHDLMFGELLVMQMLQLVVRRGKNVKLCENEE